MFLFFAPRNVFLILLHISAPTQGDAETVCHTYIKSVLMALLIQQT